MEVSEQKIVRTTTATAQPTKTYQTKKTIFRWYQVIWYILGVVEVFLAFRLFLRLVGANPASGFASFVYQVSYPFAYPFFGVLPMNAQQGSVFEWSTIMAMIVYTVVAYGLIYLLQLVKPTTPDEVEEVVDNP